MPKIKKINRDDDIKKSSRVYKSYKKPNTVVKIGRKRHKGKKGTVKPHLESSSGKALFNAQMATARKVTSASIRKTEDLAKRREESSHQEEVEQVENIAIGAAEDLGTQILHRVPEVAKKVHDKERDSDYRINKKIPDIKHAKEIKTTTRSIRKADMSVKTASTTTVEAQKASVEAGRKFAITTEKMINAGKSEQMARKSVEWVKKIVKGIIEATKTLVASLTAASIPVVLILVLAGCIAGIVASSFGIFFTEQAGNETSLRDVILSINQNFSDQIAEATSSVTYDDLEIRGSRASWADILAIYAVEMTTNSVNPQDAATVTDEKIARLQEIFDDMNSFTSYTEQVTETEQVQGMDEDGNPLTDENGDPVLVDQEVERTVLHIELTSLSAASEAVSLGFTEEQMAQVNALLSVDYRTWWGPLLFGIGGGSQDLVNVALSQLGNEGGETYWRWAGLESRCEWCALFVSWCADQTGLLAAGQVPYFSFCSDGMAWYQAKGAWIDRSEVNASNYEDIIYPGMIIFFDWADRAGRRDGVSDHVGIVTGVSGGTIYTVEGNNGDAVVESSYSVDSESVMGFGVVG